MPASIILLEFSLHLNNDFACESTAIDFVTHPIRFRNSISGVDGNDEMNDCPIDTRPNPSTLDPPNVLQSISSLIDWISTQSWYDRIFNDVYASIIGHIINKEHDLVLIGEPAQWARYRNYIYYPRTCLGHTAAGCKIPLPLRSQTVIKQSDEIGKSSSFLLFSWLLVNWTHKIENQQQKRQFCWPWMRKKSIANTSMSKRPEEFWAKRAKKEKHQQK